MSSLKQAKLTMS